jgi:hypothetical protein
VAGSFNFRAGPRSEESRVDQIRAEEGLKCVQEQHGKAFTSADQIMHRFIDRSATFGVGGEIDSCGRARLMNKANEGYIFSFFFFLPTRKQEHGGSSSSGSGRARCLTPDFIDVEFEFEGWWQRKATSSRTAFEVCGQQRS